MVRARGGFGLRLALGLAACLLASGCTSALHKQATALSSATAPVVDAAEKAYKDANAIHDLRVDYDAAVEFDQKSPVYNPRKIKPLLSEKDLDIRLSVLKGLQLYVKTVTALTNGTDSKELDAAASSFAGSLAGVADALLPESSSSTTETVTTTEGGASTTETVRTSVAADAVSATEKNALAAAVKGLGLYLGSRKVKKELPGLIEKMDPVVEKLCHFLGEDVDTLKSAEKLDFNFIINQQTLFLEQNKSMDPAARRTLIMQLPGVVRRMQASGEELDTLKAAALKLEMTHHALATEAQGNNPESLKTKIGELSAAGESLGKYYSSLPAK